MRLSRGKDGPWEDLASMYLGIDIGGTKCAVALGSDGGEIIGRMEIATDSSSAPVVIIDDLVSHAKCLLGEQKISLDQLAGIGVSCGGPLDSKYGTILAPPNLPLWTHVPIKSLMENAFPDTEVFVENDANATALAEWKFGAGKGVQTMAFVTLGTGIGAGLILEGKLYRGINDMAGELGHQTILMDGPRCGCGKKGCLEALASGPAIGRLARESLNYGRGKRLLEIAGGKAASITARHVVEAAKGGDPLSIGVLEEAGTYIGLGLANLMMIINPERIVLGTMAVHAGDLLIGPIRRAVKEFAWARTADNCEIVPAALGDRAQDLAAIVLPLLAREMKAIA